MDGQAPQQLSTLPSLGLVLCRIGPCAAGSSPPPPPPGRAGKGLWDTRKQEGSKPAMCAELLPAQGLHLIPFTPAL